MHNINIKTKVYANAIVNYVRSSFKKDLDISLVGDIVRDTLKDEGWLDAAAYVAWTDYASKKGVCPFSPEQLLEMAPFGLVPGPIELFVKGQADLDSAVQECIQLTMVDAIAPENWAEETEFDGEELSYDLFYDEGRPADDPKNREWWVTDKDGNRIADLCPECREELDRQMPEEKQKEITNRCMKQVKN